MVIEVTTASIWELLKTIPDPEIPAVSIVDLGIVRNVEFDDNQFNITITPTYSGCPAFSFMKEEIIRHLESEKIDAIRQKNMIQGSFRSDRKVILVCLPY